MAEHIIPAGNWHIALAEVINDAASGDRIIVDTDEKKELGEIAKGRMCPDKDVTFEVRPG